jgi:hypothetical protein
MPCPSLDLGLRQEVSYKQQKDLFCGGFFELLIYRNVLI